MLNDPVILPEESEHSQVMGSFQEARDQERKAENISLGKHSSEDGTHRSGQSLDHVDNAHNLGSLRGRDHMGQKRLSGNYVHDSSGCSEEKKAHRNSHGRGQGDEGHGHCRGEMGSHNGKDRSQTFVHGRRCQRGKGVEHAGEEEEGADSDFACLPSVEKIGHHPRDGHEAVAH